MKSIRSKQLLVFVLLMSAQFDYANCQAATQSQIPTKPVAKYGRIDQLINQKGATLPSHLRKLIPILDLTPPSAEQKVLTGEIVESFPAEWEGTWKGNVTVSKRECLEFLWLAQPASAYRASQFFKPGINLSLICRFYKDGGELKLSPPVAMGQFTQAEDILQAVLAKYADDIKSSDGGIQVLESDISKTVPTKHTQEFPFGKRYGPEMGGTFEDSQILSNQLRELGPGEIEQDLVTSGTTKSMYGKSKPVSSMSETVVRLTRKDDKLLVSIAYVQYESDGMFISKRVLDGVLEREGD